MMAETTQNQEMLHIQKPLPGQSSVLAVDPGTTVYLDFPLDQAEAFFQPNGDLIFRFENGEQIELQSFENVLSSTDLVLLDGTELSGDQILETIQPGAGEPAAGATPPSGGAGEYDDYLGDSPDGIDRLGTLGPREFGFNPEEPNIEGADVGVPPEPSVPPQAFDDYKEFLVDSMLDERNGVIARFYDIDAQGNVLNNDIPEGVSVVGFDIEGSNYAPGTSVQLSSGAQFQLSSDGTYRYVYDNIDTFTGEDEVISAGSSSTLFGDIDPGYEFAAINFDMDSLEPSDRLLIQYTDQDDNTYSAVVTGGLLEENNGEWDLIDDDGIKTVQLTGLRGEVTFDSLELIDSDSNLVQETINYTIADDANGLESSANLFLSFADSPATFADVLDTNLTQIPETLA